jgi:hypothetical protein
MFRVSWIRHVHGGTHTRWFQHRNAAIRFYHTRKVAVVFDAAGNRICL